MTNLISYLPDLHHEIREFVVIMDTEDMEFDDLANAVQRLLDDQFIETASEAAIKRRELPLQIRPDPAVETLEFRRKRLVNRYATRPPFTIRYLQQRLDALVGAGLAVVSVDVQNFVLIVTINVPDAAYFKEIIHTVTVTKPANLIYIQSTSTIETIALEEHAWATPLERDLRLGTSWRLGVTPFATHGEEVQIV